MAEVDTTISVCKEVDAQGLIWWDLEGHRYPQPQVSYVGDPRIMDPDHPQHESFIPELDTLVNHKNKTMRLVDACFAKWKDAGLEVGLTLRPDSLIFNKQGHPVGREKGPDLGTAPKAAYAYKRWGCKIFYIDSISTQFGYWEIKDIMKEVPGALIMPEWATPRTFRCSAQFSYTNFTGFHRGVPPEIQAAWPDAFIGMANVNWDDEKSREDLLHAVGRGNLPIFDCHYRSSAIPVIKGIYAKTGTKCSPKADWLTVETEADNPLAIVLSAKDADGDSLTYRILAPPQHGELVDFDADSGEVTYVPVRKYSGPDCFNYAARDSTGLSSNRGSVKITVGEGSK
ncbi:MAG: cadherin-like domain-containing protein [Planctomycetes bacterium]|nr:cadherin-like domain-containing protein [Planctomycetota bacterium]